MGLSRALATIAAPLCIAAILAMAWSGGPSSRVFDPSSPQLVELRENLEELPSELPPPDVASTSSIPSARVADAHLFEAVGLGPRNAHPMFLLRPPRG